MLNPGVQPTEWTKGASVGLCGKGTSSLTEQLVLKCSFAAQKFNHAWAKTPFPKVSRPRNPAKQYETAPKGGPSGRRHRYPLPVRYVGTISFGPSLVTFLVWEAFSSSKRGRVGHLAPVV